MNETTGKAASCMAITEKKPHRPGGCMGIFFQLFDWNRRFAKKKLFSRKLLPSVRAKQATKKFGGDEKMPKIKPHLIADENCEGSPNVKKNGSGSVSTGLKHEMRAAGLVVRLMGLESMPSVNRDKHKKVSNAATCDIKEDKFVNNHSGTDIEVFNLGKGKVESRPQKLQKTGQFDKQAVTRFGAEALQIRNVLSRSRKHRHSNLACPVKSPRLSASRNVSRTSRLIDAATRILEPGLQATNRAKCALSYTNSMSFTPKSEVLKDGMGLGAMPADFGNQRDTAVNYDMGVARPFMGQTSCKNCGNLLEAKDSTPTIEKRIVASPVSAEKMSSQGSERSKARPMVSVIEQEWPEVNHPELIVLSSSAERFDNNQAFNEDGKPVSLEDQVQGQVRSQQQRDEISSTAFQQKTDTQTDMSVGRSRVPPKAKSNHLQSRRAYSASNAVTGAKDFVSLNRSLSSRSRVSKKIVNGSSDTERKFCSRRDDSLSPPRTSVRKRRTVSVNAQLESTGIANSKSVSPKNIKCDSVGGKKLEPNAHNVGRECIRARTSLGASNRADDNEDHGVVSFTINSQLRRKNFVSSGINGTRDHIDKIACYQNGLSSEDKDGKLYFQRQMPLNGDSLGALLELKLKELTSQEEDELTVGGAAPKRSTAVILQELISALTAQQPFSPNSPMVNVEKTLQTGGRARNASVGFSHDGDYMSPGSVLEASFSNESCLSSSLDDYSVQRLHYDSMDYSREQSQPVKPDVDLVDSVMSMNEGNVASKFVTDLLNCTSRALQSIRLASCGLMRSRFNYVKEVILNAELFLSSTSIKNSDRTKNFLVGPILFDDLEPLTGNMWTNYDCLLGYQDSKDSSRVKSFIFDSLIEYLDSKYGQCGYAGFKTWRTVHLFVNTEMLIDEVIVEVRRWTNFAGMTTDEIVEWEMSHALGKWTDYEIEEFETGAEIDWDILNVLVDETVKELWDCTVASF